MISCCGILKKGRVLYAPCIRSFIVRMKRLSPGICVGSDCFKFTIHTYFRDSKATLHICLLNLINGCDQDFVLHVTNMFPSDETDIF